MKIISAVGARPNFMKIAPFLKAIRVHNETRSSGQPAIEHILVHTGQHYDHQMSAAFFDAMNIPAADINLGIGSGTHAEQVGRTMIEFEKVLREHRPDWVVVLGDVNATCACSITAKKENVLLAHIEAGLRSNNLSMPEEINRLVTDRLSDLLFAPDLLSVANLRAEGVPPEKVRFVGNIMIDTLEEARGSAIRLDLHDILRRNLLYPEHEARVPAVRDGQLVVLTLHRPANVDHRTILEKLTAFLVNEVASEIAVVWPVHPRARRQLEAFGLWDQVVNSPRLILLHPIGYHDMLRLNLSARVMLTDSGGLQEECCVLGTPCLTLRMTTERPVTLRVHGGTSVLVGNDTARIRDEYRRSRDGERVPFRPELWDGQTARRIVADLVGTAGGASLGTA